MITSYLNWLDIKFICCVTSAFIPLSSNYSAQLEKGSGTSFGTVKIFQKLVPGILDWNIIAEFCILESVQVFISVYFLTVVTNQFLEKMFVTNCNE